MTIDDLASGKARMTRTQGLESGRHTWNKISFLGTERVDAGRRLSVGR